MHWIEASRPVLASPCPAGWPLPCTCNEAEPSSRDATARALAFPGLGAGDCSPPLRGRLRDFRPFITVNTFQLTRTAKLAWRFPDCTDKRNPCSSVVSSVPRLRLRRSNPDISRVSPTGRRSAGFSRFGIGTVSRVSKPAWRRSRGTACRLGSRRHSRLGSLRYLSAVALARETREISGLSSSGLWVFIAYPKAPAASRSSPDVPSLRSRALRSDGVRPATARGARRGIRPGPSRRGL